MDTPHVGNCLSITPNVYTEELEEQRQQLNFCENGITKHPSVFWKLLFDVMWFSMCKEGIYYGKVAFSSVSSLFSLKHWHSISDMLNSIFNAM